MQLIIFILIHLIANCISDNKKCGIPRDNGPISSSSRIVNGYDLGYYRYPWFAALMRNNETECGGALIGPRTVLTAAHCYKNYLSLSSTSRIRLEDVYTVKLGIYNSCTTENTTQQFHTIKVQVHDLYKSKEPYFDIAILTLDNDTSAFEAICLPKQNMTEKPMAGTVPGLGTLRYQGSQPCTVHEARLLIYNDSMCKSMINSTGNNGSSLINAFCGGYIQGGIDTCQGDSGGPFQIQNADGSYAILGLVSFGFHCALPDKLGVYTDVSAFVDWIHEKAGISISSLGQNFSQSPQSTSLPAATLHQSHKHPFWRPVEIVIYRHGTPRTVNKYKLIRP